MPGTIYNPQLLAGRSVVPADIPAAVTLEVVNNGMTFLYVSTSGNVTLTIANKLLVDGQAAPDLVFNHVGAVDRVLGPFPRSVYNNVAGNLEIAINTPGNIAHLRAYQLAGAV